MDKKKSITPNKGNRSTLLPEESKAIHLSTLSNKSGATLQRINPFFLNI